MTHHPVPRGISRRALLKGGAAAVGAASLGGWLAACGDTPEQQATNGTTSEPGDVDLSEVHERLRVARAVPQFEPPGPAFDASGAAGMHLFYLAITFNVEIVQNLYRGVQEAAAAAGCTTSSFDARGEPPLYVAGFEQAINQGVDCVLLESIQNSLVAEPMRRAQEAGIKVVMINEVKETGPDIPEPDAQVAFDYVGGAELDADWVLADAEGRDINLMIFHAESIRHREMADAIRARIETHCTGDCRVQAEQVNFADFATRLPSLAQTVMTRDPDINYIIPVIDGMVLNIVPGLRQAGVDDRVKIATYNGTPSVMEMLKDRDVVHADVGGPHVWEGWQDVDQALRILTDNEPVPGESRPPNRLFDATNIDEIDLSAPEEEWYDTAAAKDGFRELWGVA